jgi:prepilin-type N-terminal cleavage/methylation domain-containing protein
MKIHMSHSSGFTLVELMTVVGIVGMLASIAIPNFVNARATSQAGACINNLRQLDYAVQLFALDQKKQATDTYALTDLYPYINLTSVSNSLPPCPRGGTYSPGTCVTNAPTCSLSTLLTAPHTL